MEGPGRSQWRSGGSKWSTGGSIDKKSQIPITVMNLKPYQSEKLDPNPHYKEKLDPDPHKSEALEALEAQNRAVDVHHGGLEAQNGALGVSVDQ